MGREWQSPEGNFYGSTLINIRDGDPPPATLGFVAALAAFEAFAAFVDPALLRLKWPNDLLACTGNCIWAKLSGILLERRNDQIVAGFGANLAHHPLRLDRPVTSLVALRQIAPAVEAFHAILAEGLATWIARWRDEGLAPIRATWLERAHPPGTSLSVSLPDGGWIEGAFDGLDADCALRLRLADGTTRVIHAGDVFLL